MWHIVIAAYIFTTAMFSIAQPGIARKLIYLTFWTILPTLFFFWSAMIRHRNRMMKLQEQAPRQPEKNEAPQNGGGTADDCEPAQKDAGQ